MNRNKAIQGVLLLTMSSFFLRGIGMIYRIVLSERIGMEGMGLYQLIMTVYGLFSMLACAGLAVVMADAEPQLKQPGRVIAPPAAQDGVAWAIEHCIL